MDPRFEKCHYCHAQERLLFDSIVCNDVVSLLQIPGGHNLFVQDKEVAGIIENVFRKFKLMLMKKDDASKANLLTNLKRINSHLEARPGSRFLTGDTMCCFDCELMPKLQHIRVAGAFFADFHVPGMYYFYTEGWSQVENA